MKDEFFDEFAPSNMYKFIVPEGYSVKDNTGEDKDEFPYIVSKD